MGCGHDHGQHVGDRGGLLITLGVASLVLVAEVIGAAITGSLALLVDAVHMLTDVSGLIIAALAAAMMLRPADDRRTWGWARAEVLAAALQALVLLVAGIYATVEGIQRLIDPPVVSPEGIAVVGVLGLAANLVGLALLASRRKHNLNMRAAFLEVANDALGSVAVLVSAAVVYFTGWVRADAVAGLFIAALILPRAYTVLKSAANILMEAAPAGLDLDEVRAHMLKVSHVESVHDLHASVVATGMPILTAHVVLADECFSDGHAQSILQEIQDCLAHHHDVAIEHCTIQLETVAAASAHLDHMHA